MLDLALAQQLRAAGLTWEPRPGDRFVLPLPDMQDEVFILSNVIADVHRFENGNVIGFNGTTEWALDALEASEAVWVPREDQLRVLLGGSFESLEPLPEPGGGFAVTASGERYVDVSADNAYARALLGVLSR